MAQRGVHPERERFGCWICWDLLKDPVTTGCGHSFCKSCFNTHWDNGDERGSYSCPQCGTTFTTRHVLKKSTMAACLPKKMKNLGLHDAPERTQRQREPGLPQPEPESESETESESESESESEPQTRAEFLRYSQNFTLDPNTAHKYLSLSEGNRRVTRESREQSYPDHPDRFTKRCQVLSREPLDDPCYWEVEVDQTHLRLLELGVAVTDKNICRVGTSKICKFGDYDESWMLRCIGVNHDFVDKGEKISLPGPVSSKVGVYHSAGVLKFYRVVSDTMTLLHRVDTESTEPLYAGLWVYRYGDTAKFCRLRRT